MALPLKHLGVALGSVVPGCVPSGSTSTAGRHGFLGSSVHLCHAPSNSSQKVPIMDLGDFLVLLA